MTFTQHQEFLAIYKKYYCHQTILPYSKFFNWSSRNSNFILKSLQISDKNTSVLDTSRSKYSFNEVQSGKTRVSFFFSTMRLYVDSRLYTLPLNSFARHHSTTKHSLYITINKEYGSVFKSSSFLMTTMVNEFKNISVYSKNQKRPQMQTSAFNLFFQCFNLRNIHFLSFRGYTLEKTKNGYFSFSLPFENRPMGGKINFYRESKRLIRISPCSSTLRFRPLAGKDHVTKTVGGLSGSQTNLRAILAIFKRLKMAKKMEMLV